MSQKVYDAVFASIKEKLEQNIAPWAMPWNKGNSPRAAFNAVTGKRYSGSNAGLLFLSQLSGEHSSPKYATYKQWQQKGHQVKKGEKSTPIVFWSKIEDEKTEKDFMFVRYYSVFNECQLEGYVMPETKQIEFNPIHAAELIKSASPMNMLRITHDQQRAFYSPSLDYINMPKPESFVSADAYYSVLFHEMGHATGHESRLKRDMKNVFGDHKYSREELVAELTSAFLSAECGLKYSIDAHADYCKSWLKQFNDHPKEMLQAFSQAVKASDYILNRKEEKTNSESEAA